MTDTLSINNGNTIHKVLGTEVLKVKGVPGSYKDIYASCDSAELKRHLAVSTALELIRADLSAGNQRAGSWLEGHLENLSGYADTIQSALEVNDK